MATRKVKLKNKSGDYLYPYTDNIPTASTSTAGKVKLDSSPIAGSNNAITSGAVYTALNNKLDKTGTAAKATADANGNNIASTYATKTELQTQVYSIYQAKADISGTDVILKDETTIYQKTVSQNTTFTFNLNSLSKKNQVITFELFLSLSAANLTLKFPSTVSWLGSTVPSTTTAQKYLFAFRSFNAGQTWLGNLQGVFA